MQKLENENPSNLFYEEEQSLPSKVDFEKPFILYFDSLSKADSLNMKCLRQYIESEYIDKKLKTREGDEKLANKYLTP